MSESLRDQLIRHEGLRLKPYKCPAGKLTIGVGRNLEDVGITKIEALILLNGDIERCEIDVKTHLPWSENLSTARFNVLVNMCFNLGITKLLKFKATLTAIEEGRYEDAAEHMLKSLWAEQVGQRAVELAEIMKNEPS